LYAAGLICSSLSTMFEREIKQNYLKLLRCCQYEYDKRSVQLIKRTYRFLVDHHECVEPKWEATSIHQSVELARMITRELGLEAISVASAMVFDLARSHEHIRIAAQHDLGNRVGAILKELIRISNLDTSTTSGQAENMRNLVLSFSTDFRVILILIAERLHRMRHIQYLDEKEQIESACESKYIYAPLAHRLGLYNMMSEMEDISMSVLEKEVYQDISRKLKASYDKRQGFIRDFIKPVKDALDRERFTFEITGRPKAISSIWRKMRKKNVEFEEVYDRFAIRIILDSSPRKEKSDCWRAYSVITDIYQPNPDRLRDWISVPKSNGYESLHTTVVVPGGEWVEVQIRTRRMNEIAERGLAAHWKYKGIKGQAGIDEWLNRVREAIDQEGIDNIAPLMDDLKLSQYNKEIFVFTPQGDLKKFPEGSTVLDFAFDIHTEVGSSCSGARVNGKNVPIRYHLRNGDKVEILSSKTQKAKMDWLNYVATSKAKSKIKQALKDEKLTEAEQGKEILKRRFKNWKIDYNDETVRKVIQHFKYKDSIDLHFDIATEKLDPLQIKEFLTSEDPGEESGGTPIEDKAVERIIHSSMSESEDVLVIDEQIANIDYRLAKCCSPIHGDDVFGFVTRGGGITIHRMNCPNAHQLLTRYGYRVVKARWTKSATDTRFAVTLKVTGLDDIGIVSNISDVISKDLQVNMRSISIDSNDGMFEGNITLFVKDTQHLEALVRKLKKVKGVMGVRRIHEIS